MRLTTVTLAALVLAAAPVAAQAPFPGAVRVGDGWVPCSHPIAIRAGLGCVTGPDVPEPPKTFRVLAGRTYEHVAGGWRLFIVGPVQRADGRVVTLAEVVRGTDHYGRVLFEVGRILEVEAEWRVVEWQEVR